MNQAIDPPMHEGQHHVDQATVEHLVHEQLPGRSEARVRLLSGPGTVNAIARIDDDLVARFPLVGEDPHAVRADLVTEARATAEFAVVSPVPAPRPVAIGEPGGGYPLPWAVQSWVPGEPADSAPRAVAASYALAEDLAALLTALRDADTGGRTFAGDGRGGHLPDHDDWLEECFVRSEGLLDVVRLRQVWATLRTLPEVDADVMSHTDLTPDNVLITDGRLTGLLDTGGYAAADPALDLVVGWHLLDDGPRTRLRSALACSDVQWERGRAWAFQQAMGLVWYYAESSPSTSRWGRVTLDRILAAQPGPQVSK